MGSSGGGMSQREIYETQKAAREQADKELAEKNAKMRAEAQARVAASGTGGEGGEGSGAGELSKAKGGKKKATLTGEGESTFSPAASKLGE